MLGQVSKFEYFGMRSGAFNKRRLIIDTKLMVMSILKPAILFGSESGVGCVVFRFLHAAFVTRRYITNNDVRGGLRE